MNKYRKQNGFDRTNPELEAMEKRIGFYRPEKIEAPVNYGGYSDPGAYDVQMAEEAAAAAKAKAKAEADRKRELDEKFWWV